MTYAQQRDQKMKSLLAKYMKLLPEFCKFYFQDIDSKASTTKVCYAIDLLVFFEYLKDTVPNDYPDIRSLPVETLDLLTPDDAEAYLTYLTNYSHTVGGQEVFLSDEKLSRAHKLTVVKSFYSYFLSRKTYPYCSSNPFALVKFKADKKRRAHEISYLEENQIADLLECITCEEKDSRKEIDEGKAKTFVGKFQDDYNTRVYPDLYKYWKAKMDELTAIGDQSAIELHRKSKPHKSRAASWQEINAVRDTAITLLLLGTGIRISECIGLNLDDINHEEMTIDVHRKGDKNDVVPLSLETYDALLDYINNARAAYNPDPDEYALFLSLKHSRLTPKAVNNMLKKNAAFAFGRGSKMSEQISAHLLGRTFGNELYQETDDIKLVADFLGHSSMETTRSFYTTKANLEKKREYITGRRLLGGRDAD